MNATWPYITLSVAASEIVINVRLSKIFVWMVKPLNVRAAPMQVFVIRRADVISIRRKRIVFHTGFVIEHRAPDVPPYLLFWSWKPKTLALALQADGYEVSD
jgi:hypothetical protein